MKKTAMAVVALMCAGSAFASDPALPGIYMSGHQRGQLEQIKIRVQRGYSDSVKVRAFTLVDAAFEVKGIVTSIFDDNLGQVQFSILNEKFMGKLLPGTGGKMHFITDAKAGYRLTVEKIDNKAYKIYGKLPPSFFAFPAPHVEFTVTIMDDENYSMDGGQKFMLMGRKNYIGGTVNKDNVINQKLTIAVLTAAAEAVFNYSLLK